MNRTGAAKKMPKTSPKHSYAHFPLSGGERKTLFFDPEILYLLDTMADMAGCRLSEIVHEVMQYGLQTITGDENNPLYPLVAEAKGFVRSEEEEDIALCKRRVNDPTIPWKKIPDHVKGRAI